MSKQFYKISANFFQSIQFRHFKAVQERQWFEALRDVMKYFFIVKRLTVKMQAKLGTKELEKFKEEAIDILNPVSRIPKNVIKLNFLTFSF
jgi:hypothetical protein